MTSATPGALQTAIRIKIQRRLVASIAVCIERSLSQQAMAEAIGIHPNSWKKHESGQAQPSLDVLKKIAVALRVSTDFLLFEEHERGPNDDLVLQFEAVNQLPPAEQSVVKDVLESLVLKYKARRWDAARVAASQPAKPAAKKAVKRTTHTTGSHQ